VTDLTAVEALFFAALEKPSGPERGAFLDEACGNDAELRRHVERLLAAHPQAAAFLDSPAPRAVATVDEQPVREGPGTVIGPYRLMEQIGEGGMGLVFVAEQQQPVRRKVALKVIKPGMDTRQVVARFEAERQALALMDHPNIAHVLDGGATPEGRPYFVMELVRGVPITQFCDDNRLPPRERLRLFTDVCAAVQHAHTKGIIHRDLKPSNVLVTSHDGTPVVKVIDFGVAKAVGQRLTDKTVYTQLAQLVGTPLYMSPEQAGLSGLDVDTRTDIYALGVLLYELLTGTTPFDQERLRTAGYDEIRRIIREEEPPRPSKRLSTLLGQTLTAVSAQRQTDPRRLSRLCRGELDWIVMKALEKDRNRRYDTAGAFAADVQRYLADQPVLAGPPGVGYQVRKFLRRNRGRVAVAAALALVLAAGAGAVVAVQVRADRDRAAAATERAGRDAWAAASVAAAVAEARARADEAWGVADYPDRMQQATDAALAAVRRADDYAAGGTPTEETLADLAATRQAVDDLARHTRLITARLRNLEQFADSGQNTALRCAAFCSRYAEALRQFGLDPVHDPADEVARAVAASRIRDPLLGMLWDWHDSAAYLAKLHQQYPDRVPDSPDANAVVDEHLVRVIRSARQLCGGAYARWQDLLDRNDVPGLVAFAASPDALTFRSTLVAALGDDLRQAAQYPASRTFLRAAVDRYPHDNGLQFDLWRVCMVAEPPDYAEALRHISAACVLRPDSAHLYRCLGATYAGLGSYDHAAAAYRKSLALFPASAATYGEMGEALLKKQDWEGAITAYREAIRLAPDDPWVQVGLGGARMAVGRHAEGLELMLAALRQHPHWAEEPQRLLRYRAARALLSCAGGKGAVPLPPAERPAYRQQALGLLTADLTAMRKLAATDGALVHQMMEVWLGDENLWGYGGSLWADDLAPVRGPAALGLLPPDERATWEQLWADVRDLRDRTAPETTPPKSDK
jgi:serine/threonine protein kinase/tetratricopeptide (TPR) repeat protein